MIFNKMKNMNDRMEMKNNLCIAKKSLVLVAAILMAGTLFAETEDESVPAENAANLEQSEERGIELPDLTTIVTGSDVVFGSETIPDFDDVIIVDNVQSNLQLELPDVAFEETNSSVFLPEIQNDKGIYAEGKIGAGYPGSFIGEFSIMQDKGQSPFEIFYSHSAFDGYNANPLYAGFNDDTTLIKIDRTLDFKKSNFAFGGFYETLGNGLQNKVANISAINQRDINVMAKYDYNILENLVAGADFSADYYTHFANLSTPVENGSIADIATWFKNYSYWNLKPQMFITWKNSMFDTGLFGSYIFNKDFDSTSDYLVHRGDISEKFTWHYSYLDVKANAGLVFSNQISQKILVPFTLGVTYSFPVYFSDRKVTVAGEGGLLSKQNSVFELEKNFKFAALNSLPRETSDWYGKFDFTVPLKSSVTIDGEIEYAHTAFENGVYEPVYSDGGYSNGIYVFAQKNRQLLKSCLEFVYHYKLLALSAGWYASWLDVAALENAQTFALAVSLQDEKSSWGVNLSGSYSLDASDLMPCLDFEAFVRLNNAVRLVLTVNDGIKLITGQERVYAGNYITQSGSANLLVKFFF